MTLTFVTNHVHHHQLPLADEFYRLLGDDYHYIATKTLPDWLIKGGYDPTLERTYIVRPYLGEEVMKQARLLIDNSDVVIMGDSPLSWAVKRKKEGKLTFHFTERIYRQGTPWLKLPRHAWLNYKNFGQYKNTYLLCASAYTAHDFALTKCFIGKAFKWGYFTKVDNDFKLDASNNDDPQNDRTAIMWCARFLKLKHPELTVQLATRLKEKGYNFTIDMYGSGEEYNRIQQMISHLQVDDVVHLCGNMPNEELLKEMRKHEIFLFTSDQNEGWGAVLNESMANGCVPVACNAIGSAPYLIKEGINGLMFNTCDLNSLEQAVRFLLDNPSKKDAMRQSALQTMQLEWSPRIAAKNFVDLANYALSGNLANYDRREGPASWDSSTKKLHL